MFQDLALVSVTLVSPVNADSSDRMITWNWMVGIPAVR